MLYADRSKPLSPEAFANPGSEYRGTPFWAWNAKLEDGELCRQIDMMRAMGLGGFHMHSRSGMATDYLSDDFMARVKTCVDKAKRENMLAWLYDEDRWPSGAAGGLVTRDPRWRARSLVLSRDGGKEAFPLDYGGVIPGGGRKRVAAYADLLGGDGCMRSYRTIGWNERVDEGFPLFVYGEVAADDSWYNNQAYLDLLNPEAVAKFIEATHERYYEVVGDEFGKSIPAIFTDEPLYTATHTLNFADDREDLRIAWTDDFAETFRGASGMDFYSRLPELAWDLPGGEPSEFRYQFYKHLTARFAGAFAQQIGAWCDGRGIALTGHMMAESTLDYQTQFIGDAMQSLRWFGLPGVDMLCDWREWSTVKQAQSVANQLGKPGVLSELYGVTGWDADFRTYKLQGDWQAALGVTVRVHHLTWLSMEGEAKRDYPASFGDQSPWWRAFPFIEDHFARLNTALTRGRNAARIAVLHPIESNWLAYGAKESSGEVRKQLEDGFQGVTETLLRATLDFDYLSEDMLAELGEARGGRLAVGEMAYDAVVVPYTLTMRASTLDLLEAFHDAGGRVIFTSEPAACVDARPSDRVRKLYECSAVAMTRVRLLRELEPLRSVEIRDASGERTQGYLHQLREDGDARWLFICHADKPRNMDIPIADQLRVVVRGIWDVMLYDTATGIRASCAADYDEGNTVLAPCLNLHDSVLYYLSPGKGRNDQPPAQDPAPCKTREIRWKGRVPVELSEPNVLLLDQAEYRVDDDAEWLPSEEILIIDNCVRKRFDYPLRTGHLAQPWVFPDQPAEHVLWLRVPVVSTAHIRAPKLALERAAESRILLDGKPVHAKADGWYVDRAIRTVALPDLTPGSHEMVVGVPITLRAGAEWMYLLGDFGVEVRGTERSLTAPVRSLGFGSICGQGLPYYGGTVAYKLKHRFPGGKARLTVPQYRGGAMELEVDGKTVANLSLAPYAAEFDVPEGEREIKIILHGNRFNSFGGVHNADDADLWQGPNIWRTEGAKYQYEYRLRPIGILVSPILTF